MTDNPSKIVTRFAPSPTGFLHLGTARTGLFNWLYARRHGGKFHLRIEDTDKERSTQESIDSIFKALEWLNLDWDGEVVYQSKRFERHQEVAQELLNKGHAYYCYASPQELEEMRAQAMADKRSPKYDGRWRDRDPRDAPTGVRPTVRLRSQQEGSTTINDRVQGEVTLQNEQLDDFVLLRADGSPTYMLSVVVDDHDMGVTQIIRGDDHLTNTFRQNQIYQGMGWCLPGVAHLPLIHGADGAKLSKRHGAVNVEDYAGTGILPEAMINCLLRLGWSHGDAEIIPRDQATKWFNLESVGKAPARFDHQKLLSLNAHYLRNKAPDELMRSLEPLLQVKLNRCAQAHELRRIRAGLEGLTDRSKVLHDLVDLALIYCDGAAGIIDDKAQEAIDASDPVMLQEIFDVFRVMDPWKEEELEEKLRGYAQAKDIKFGKVASPLRSVVTGRSISPSLFEVLQVLGKEETLSRVKGVILSK